MEIINSKEKERPLLQDLNAQPVSRRKFLHFSGLLGLSTALIGASTMTGCKKDDNPGTNTGVNLGSGDVGILNYAYALEQLEAAFYTRVASSPYSGISAAETMYLQDIRDHEIAHREFFKTALGTNAIQALEVDFSSVNFADRASVLNTAKTFEDLGVAAYNGAGRLLTSAANLLTAGKIVSVEARHAALIRELLAANSGAGSDVVDANGLDKALTPTQVLQAAGPFIKTPLNASNLPS